MKMGIDVLEFAERDEQGKLKAREVLEFLPKREDGTSRGVDILVFAHDDDCEPSAESLIAETESTDVAPQNIETDDEQQTLIRSEGQDILPLVRQDSHGPVTWTPAALYPAANFGVKVLYRKIFVDRTGKAILEKGEIECRIFVNNRVQDMVVKNKEIRSFARMVTDRIPEAIVDYEATKADKIIECQFRQDIAGSRSIQIRNI